MKVIVCYECGKPSHKKAKCRKLKKPEKKWYDVCKNYTHQTAKCRKKNRQAKSVTVRRMMCMKITILLYLNLVSVMGYSI